MEYHNFDLRLRKGGANGYWLFADSEGHGTAETELQLDPTDPDLEALLERLARRQTDREFLEALGRRLYEFLFVGGVEILFQRSYGAVEAEPETGLRLRLRVGPPELAVLPWELLYSEADREFLGTRVVSPVVRYVEFSGAERELTTSFPLRVLLAIPRGGGRFPEVSADREKALIDKALAALGDRAEAVYLHELHEDRRVTWTRLRERLAESEFHCFHFIGHGTFQDDQGYLVLDPEDEDDGVVTDARFAELFSNHRSLKLAVLNACQTASLATSRPLEGCAARLVAAGVPAVVAMQFAIRDRAAVDFARSFYHSLFKSAERGRIDVAISQGRQVLAAKHRDQRELASPVLFMHTRSGVLFVPETGRTVRDLPLSTRALHTLEAATDDAGSASELARFKRRIRVAKGSVRVGLLAATLAFCLSWVNFLDFFTLDTRAEFLVMAVGDALAAKPLSDELKVVSIDGSDLAEAETGERVRELRRREAAAIRALAAAGARTIVLDAHFRVSGDGGFFREAESGRELVAAIRQVADRTKVLVGALERGDEGLAAPEQLRRQAAAVGHLCYESKLGLTRSLPISVAREGQIVPSLALAAVAVHRGGSWLARNDGSGPQAVVIRPDRPSTVFALSELRVPRREPGGSCRVIAAGDRVAHRFLRLTPRERLAELTLAAEELGDGLGRGLDLEGKLVVLGLEGVGDTVRDLGGDRPGYLWHADAINNLLLDVEIRPLADSRQLPIMLALAALGAALQLVLVGNRSMGVTLTVLASIAFLSLIVYAHASFNTLINPAYHLVALWAAWWLAGRVGRAWLR